MGVSDFYCSLSRFKKHVCPISHRLLVVAVDRSASTVASKATHPVVSSHASLSTTNLNRIQEQDCTHINLGRFACRPIHHPPSTVDDLIFNGPAAGDTFM
jgi:hypothetical protein